LRYGSDGAPISRAGSPAVQVAGILGAACGTSLATSRAMTHRTVLVASLLAGCGGVDRSPAGDGAFPAIEPTSDVIEYAFVHDGLERQFLAYVPPDHVPGRALVVVLHGGGGSARQMFKGHPLEDTADERGHVVIAAQGTSEEGDPGSFEWNGQASLDNGVDDVGYLDALLVGVTAQLDIDPRRHYVAGFSGGASMTVRFGAEKSERVAAIATFAGKVGLSEAGGPFVFPSEPTTPISVQMTYGTDDPNLAGEAKGDIQATSGRAGIDWWVGGLGCATVPQTTVDGVVTTDTFAGCTAGTVVRMLTVRDMPHTWPELPGDAIAGTELVLDFFADKLKP
jgi:polyhydroxybutyrate depolymerase